MQLGWIVVGIDPASVRKMTLSDPNLIGVLGNNAYPLSPHQASTSPYSYAVGRRNILRLAAIS